MADKTKFMDPFELTKWLKKQPKLNEMFFKFDVFYKGNKVGVLNKGKIRKESKLKLENGNQEDFTIKVKGNPYKAKEYLPDGWDFDGDNFVNKNYDTYRKVKVEPENKERPLTEIRDTLDLIWVLECRNPELEIRKGEDGSFEMNKPLNEINIPENYGFQIEGGTITNVNNVSTGNRQIEFAVTSSIGAHSQNVNSKTMGEHNALGADLDDLNGNPNNASMYTTTPNQGSVSDFVASAISDGFEFTEAGFNAIAQMDVGDIMRMHEKYQLAVINGEPKLMYAGVDAGSGQVIEDETLLQQYLIGQTLIERFKNDVIQDQTKTTYGEINLEALQGYLDSVKDNPRAIAELITTQANIELGEEAPEGHDADKVTIEDIKEAIIEKPSEDAIDKIDHLSESYHDSSYTEELPQVNEQVDQIGPEPLEQNDTEIFLQKCVENFNILFDIAIITNEADSRAATYNLAENNADRQRQLWNVVCVIKELINEKNITPNNEQEMNELKEAVKVEFERIVVMSPEERKRAIQVLSERYATMDMEREFKPNTDISEN